MPGRSKCCNCKEYLEVKPIAGACIDTYLPCARCFPVDIHVVITPEQIAKLEDEVALLRRCESESASVMKIIERLLQVARMGVYIARETDYQRGFAQGNEVGMENGLQLREVPLDEARIVLNPTQCRYAAKVIPLLRCALDEGHEGQCQPIR